MASETKAQRSRRRRQDVGSTSVAATLSTTEARRHAASPAHVLLDWYDRERRDLPWRFKPGQIADPYQVWLSEVMLQQTAVKVVEPYFNRFTTRWPTVAALAAAPVEEVMAAWAGLGYYSRARNLHLCARAIVTTHGGRFPKTEAELRRLPGVGPYTAAAIAAIAFGQPATPVDTNVERVVARYFAIDTPLPAAQPEIRRQAATLTPDYRAGDFAQAMMDLGASICAPRRPSCLMCPLAGGCEGRARGIEGELPARPSKVERPVRRGTAFVVLREDGHFLLRRRPEAGLLGGMLEVPSTEWTEASPDPESISRAAPIALDWLPVPGVVQHTFTHFRLELRVLRALAPAVATLELWADPQRCQWVPRQHLDRVALPSLMRKVIEHAFVREADDRAMERRGRRTRTRRGGNHHSVAETA